MEFRDLKKQYQVLKEEIDSSVMRVLQNADYISGSEVVELEEALAAYVGVKHCITCGNGTDALMLSLMAWGVHEGDAVFVPDFTFFASGEAVAAVGAVPVFVDVERNTFNISADALEKAVESVLKEGKLIPRAVVVVDLFGQPANYPVLKQITEKNKLLILEDGAQGFGASIQDKKICSFGDISTTSFFPAKPLGCYGDGGAVFTDNDEWAEIIHSLRIHGKGKNKYDNIRIGMNSRLDTIQAAVLKVKLKAFAQSELEQVNQVAKWYNEMLEGLVITPKIMDGFYSSWAQYTIVCQDSAQRESLQNRLKEDNIPTMVYYAKGMHEQKAFEKQESDLGGFDNTLYLKDRVLSLPIHPYLQKRQVKEIAEKIESFLYTLNRSRD